MASFFWFSIKKTIRNIMKIPGRAARYIGTLRDDWAYSRRVHLATTNPVQYYSSEYFLAECGGYQGFGSGDLPHKYYFASSLLPDQEKLRILDYGCGRGELTGLLSTKGFGVKGVDISPDAIEIARKSFPEARFEAIGLSQRPTGDFDYIFLLDVVEHIKEKSVEELLATLTLSLSMQGCLCVHTNDAEQDNKPEISRWHPEHINLYTARRLAQTMMDGGLDVTLLLRRHRTEEGYSGGIWCVGRKSDRAQRRAGQKILITYEATVGDQLCLTPAIAEYRRIHPHDYLAVKVTHPEIYLNNPYVDEIVWGQSKSRFDVVKRLELPAAPQYRPMTLQEAAAVQLGVELTEARDRPQLYLSELERRVWSGRFRRPNGLVVGFAPYSGWVSREWSMDRWRQVADWLEQEMQATLVFLGKADRPYPWIGFNLAGLTDLRELGLVLEQCDLLLSVDNGITHMAAAVGTPTVALYGPVLAKFRACAPFILPVQATDCIGCYHDHCWTEPPRTCPEGHHKCMRDITVDQIMSACRQIFALDGKKDFFAKSIANIAK